MTCQENVGDISLHSLLRAKESGTRGEQTERPSLLKPSKTQIQLAVADLCEGFRRNWMWTALAMQDIKMRYRGSILGPFWLTITTLVMVAAIGSIYPRILNIPSTDYVPYLATGLVIWSLISSLITEGCNTFISMQHIIRQVRLPFALYAFHTSIVCVVSCSKQWLQEPPRVC